MHAVMLAWCVAAAVQTAPVAARSVGADWQYTGLMLDGLAGASESQSGALGGNQALDLFTGLRLAGRWTMLRPLTAGLELTLRNTAPVDAGASPFFPLPTPPGYTSREAGRLHRHVRQTTHVAAAGTLGMRLNVFGLDAEGFVQAGPSASWRAILVQLDAPQPYARGYATVGGFVGWGLLLTVGPGLVRTGASVTYERPPQLSTASATAVLFDVGVGARW